MLWQEIMAGLIVVAAGAYVFWRLRARKDEASGPDVPVSRLTRKRSRRGSCGH